MDSGLAREERAPRNDKVDGIQSLVKNSLDQPMRGEGVVMQAGGIIGKAAEDDAR